VAVVVGWRRRRTEVGLRDDLALEVGVGRVDAGVEHRDRDTGAGVSSAPSDRSPDLRGAVLVAGEGELVEPDLVHARHGVAGHDREATVVGLGLVDVPCGGADRGQPLGTGEGREWRTPVGRLLVVDDDGDRIRGAVVDVLSREPGDVEQRRVQSVGDQSTGIRRDHVDVAVDLLLVESGCGPVRSGCRVDRDSGRAVGVRREIDPVAGDQGDLLGFGGDTSWRIGRGGRRDRTGRRSDGGDEARDKESGSGGGRGGAAPGSTHGQLLGGAGDGV
jgi:hypothetical protein